MKKSVLATLAVSFGLLGGSFATSTAANAATWHKGMPKAFIGKWKRHIRYDTSTNGKKFEWAYYFQGTKNQITTGMTQASPYGGRVLYHKYLGHHTYKFFYLEMITNKRRSGYLHWKSKSKIGVRWSFSNKYAVFNSRKPILSYLTKYL